MKINGNADIEGSVSGAFKHYDALPENPKVGTWAFINKTLMMCVEVESKPVWIPLSPERNTVVRPQDTPSTIWIVDHNFDRNNVMMQCFDSENKVVVPDSIEPIDSNSTRIVFTEAISGSTIAMFGYEEGTSISSGEVNNNGGGVPVSTVTAFTSKEAMLKFGTGYIGLDGQHVYYKSFPQLYIALGGEEGSEVPIKLPDANGQKAFFRGGRLDSSGFHTIQEQSIQSHSHGITTYDVHNPGAAFIHNDSSGDSLVSSDNMNPEIGEEQRDRYYSEHFGSEETRPINFSGYWAIKAFGSESIEGELDVTSVLDRIQSLESNLSSSNETIQSLTEANDALALELNKNKSSRLSYASAEPYVRSGVMFGDENLTYDNLRVNLLRSGDAVSIAGQIDVSGFSENLDNDSSCAIRLDIKKLGSASNLYSSAIGNGYGTANFQFYDDASSADRIAAAGYVDTDSNQIELRLLETVSASAGQKADRAIIRFSANFSVN